MAEDVDYEDVLEGTVDEVKNAIKELEDPDYEALLEAEKEGKDRKTVKEFIESRIPEEDEEEEEAEESEEVLTDTEEDIVEDIEESTSGGLLGAYSSTSVLAAGLVLGVLIGFAAGGLADTEDVVGTTADPDLVKDSVATIAGVGLEEEPEVSDPEIRHSMYNMVVSTTVQADNETVEQDQEIYVTLDGEKMFLVQEQMGQTVMPIDIQEAMAQAEAAAQQEDIPEDELTGEEPAPAPEEGAEAPEDGVEVEIEEE